MTSVWIVWLSCIVLSTGLARCWEHSDGDALKIALATHGATLVAFVSPSELKSQNLEKEWLSAILISKHPLLSIDCDADPNTCAEHEVDSRPALYAYEKGSLIATYLGPIRGSGLSNFISRLARPIVTEVTTDSIDVFRDVDEAVFVAHIGPGDQAAQETFVEIAKRYRDEFTFGLVSDVELVKEEGSGSPTVTCSLKEGGTVTRTSTSLTDSTALEKFVTEASRPVVGELTAYNQQRLLNRGWPMVYLFAKTEQDRSRLRMELYSFAKGYYDSLTCVTVDPLEFPELQGEMGLEPGVFPSGAVHQLSKDRIYPYPRNLPVDSQSLQKWGLDVWQGRVKPWVRPGAATSVDDPGPTKTAKRRVSLANIPGVTIRVGGHDEL